MTDADRQEDLVVGQVERLLQSLVDGLRREPRVDVGLTLQHDRELVAAQPCEHPLGTCGGAPGLRDGLPQHWGKRREHQVARAMTSALVDGLEVIDAEVEQVKASPEAALGREAGLEVLDQKGPVGQLGESVVESQPRQSLIGFLQDPRALLALGDVVVDATQPQSLAREPQGDLSRADHQGRPGVDPTHGPVRSHNAELPVKGVTASQSVLQRTRHTDPVEQMHPCQLGGQGAVEVLRSDAMDAVLLLRPLHGVGGGIPRPAADVRQGLALSDPRGVVSQGALGEQLLLDITHDHRDAHDGAVMGAHRHGAQPGRDERPALTTDRELDVLHGVAGEGEPEAALPSGPVLLGNQVDATRAADQPLAETEQPLRPAVPADDATIWVKAQDSIVRAVHGRHEIGGADF